jgi:hypothetical protein
VTTYTPKVDDKVVDFFGRKGRVTGVPVNPPSNGKYFVTIKLTGTEEITLSSVDELKPVDTNLQ